MAFDPICEDPQPSLDRHATSVSLAIESQGETLLGLMYRPQGTGLRPTILLLHGFPGYERNFDLAQILRRAGYNTLVFHYRGSWGSSGTFSFGNVLEDVRAVLDFLRLDEVAKSYAIDTSRLILIGHSMGGWAALMTAATDPLICAVASIAGANLGLRGRGILNGTLSREATVDYFAAQEVAPLGGASVDALVDELATHGEAWDLLEYIDALARCPLLLIGGERDQEVPLNTHHRPLVEALTGAENLSHIALNADHAFGDCRIALARVILNWLSDRVL